MIQKKWFLYCTEFFAGMSVMAIELAASRLLAPYLSSSQIIWTIIIGIIMICMALGNFIGGRLADKKPNPSRLYFILLIASVWVAITPLVVKYVIGGLTFTFALFITSNFLLWLAIFSCLFLFAFPLTLLGMVTPTLIKTCLKDIKDSGKIVGELNALHTLGSILGTFLPTFLVIPLIGTAATFIIFASFLFILACIYFVELKVKLVKTAICFVILLALAINTPNIRFSISQEDVLLEDESIYNYLVVKETSDSIILSTNVLFGVQSTKSKKEGLNYGFFDYALTTVLMADYYNKESLDVLILGLGSGTIAYQLDKHFEKCNVTGVEIDQKIVNIAKEYFDLPESCNAVVGDGRYYLTNSGKYDVIIVDAYQDITIPFWMSTVEFFKEVKKHLKDDGVMLCNLNMVSERENSISNYVMDTIDYVYDDCYYFDIPGYTNRVVFSSNSDQFINKLTEHKDKNALFIPIFNAVNRSITLYHGKNRLLTDDKAPVELLGMITIDDMISKELQYYKNLFKGKSISEIFDLLK